MRAHSRPARIVTLAAIALLAVLGPTLPVAAASHPGSNPEDITRVGSRVFFSAETSTHGRELWVSDGTPSGTHEVEDINPAGSSDPSELTAAGGRLFFAANDGTGPELWVSDGTADGTEVLTDGAEFGRLTNVGGTLFALFRSGTPNTWEVWKSDGTQSGTDFVDTLPGSSLGEAASGPNGDYYFFVANDTPNGDEWRLWKSDGTAAGSRSVKKVVSADQNLEPAELVASGGLLYFRLRDLDFGGGIQPGDLWKSDGTRLGTMLVKDLTPGDVDFTGNLTNSAGTLFFTLFDDHGRELWKSDGTADGTRLVKDINQSDTSEPRNLTNVAGRLFFSADDGTGRDLWKSRGTKATTVKVDTAAPYECASFVGCSPAASGPAAVGSRLFFASEEGTNGIELWVSDGTGPGTHMVKSIKPGPGGSAPSGLASGGSMLFFVANDGSHGRELWVSDGTSTGTHLVLDINPG